jgi:hypothetical protein
MMQSNRSNSVLMMAATLTGAALIGFSMTGAVFACPFGDKVNGVLKGTGSTPTEASAQPIDLTKMGLIGGSIAAIAGLVVAKKVQTQRLAKVQPPLNQPPLNATNEVDHLAAAAFSIPVPAEALKSLSAESEERDLTPVP